MDVRKWWTWLLDKDHRAALGSVGAGIAALIAAGWAVFVHFDETERTPPVEPERSGIAAGGNVNVTAGGGGVATLQTDDPKKSSWPLPYLR